MNFSKTKKLLYVLLLCFVSAICTFVSACSTTNVAKPNAISVTFNQGEEVIYETDSLEKLRPLLEVKQAFESGKEEVTNKYLLTGSLEVPNGDEPQEVCLTVTLQANKDICTTITVMVTAVNHICVFEEENSFVSKHPTCTEEGEKTFICECGKTKTEAIEKSAHVYGSYKSDHVANCTKNDTQTATCKNCGATDVKEIAGTALGHNFEETVYAWTQSGKSYACTASAKCARCKEVFVANASVDEVVTSGTCETEGSIRYTATFNFGEGETAFPVEAQIKDVATAVLGHDYKVVVTAPTCTKEGYTTHTCSRCSDTYTDSEVEALGHDYGAASYVWAEDYSSCTATRVCSRDNHTETETAIATSVTTAAKCEEDGSIVYTTNSFVNAAFEVQTYSRVLTATGHDYGAWASNGNDTHTKVCANDNSHTVTENCFGGSATCTEKAICVDCHSAHGSALDHAYGAASYVWAEDYSSCTATRVCSRDNNHIETETVASTAVTTPAKCEEDGKIVYTSAAFANAAFAAQTHTTVLDKLDHNYDAVVTAPTCTEEGYTTHTCSRCSDVYTDSKVAATGHDYELNVCQNDNSHVLSYQEVLDLAYGLAKDASLKGTYKLEGVISKVNTEYSAYYGNITVTMVVEGNTQKTIQCFRLKGTGTDIICVGDTITVTGKIKNYNGTVEFDEACTLVSYVHICEPVGEYLYDNENHWKNCSRCGNPAELTVGEHDFDRHSGLCNICGVHIKVVNTVTETISFATAAQRTEFNTSKQVWEQNGVILTNNKGSSTSNVADYIAPARFYKSSQIIIEIKGISKIVFDCNSASYATALKNSIQSGNVTISSDKVTVEFDERVDSFTIATLSAQVRMDSVTVVYVKPCVEHIPALDDGDCTTEIKCLACDLTLTAAKAHVAGADDGDCTTAVKCVNCDKNAVEGKASHVAGADDGDCTTAVKCANCDKNAVEGKASHVAGADDGDCTTAVKCVNCDKNAVEAEASHVAGADDGDCTTAVKCVNCDKNAVEGKESHVADADDGDCTTAVKCVNCDKNAVEEKEHSFIGEWQKDANKHWHVCQNSDCNVVDEKQDHISSGAATEYIAETCTVCEYVITPALGHEHAYTTRKYDETSHWDECRCGDKVNESTHIAGEDDGDCTTSVKCENCEYIMVEAEAGHVAGADDGDCTTAVKCENCDKNAIEGKASHVAGADDGDCTTAVKCVNCDKNAIEGKASHVAGADDGDCTTAVKCGNCDKNAVEEKTHDFTGDDGKCVNVGCEFKKTTVSVSIADYADANDWVNNSDNYLTISMDHIVTVTANGGQNTGKYYSTDESWRIYATDSPAGSITITLKEGYELFSIKVTCETGTYAKLELNGVDISNVSTSVNGSSVILQSVRDGDGKHIRITSIEVVYIAIECKHTNTKDVEEKPATCTQTGLTAGVQCADCGKILSGVEKIPTIAHSYNSEVTAPTCTEKGYTTHTCEDCGDSYEDTYVNTLDHNYVDGVCSVCEAKDPNAGGGSEETQSVITFKLGDDGSAEHVDGSTDKATYSETNNDYTLSITGGSKMYPNSRDAKGNGALKFGSSSAAGKFSFAVSAEVSKVVIYVAGYKDKTAKIAVNSKSYTISTFSDNGAYTAIKVDTSTTKTVTFTTVSGGYRCMINTIEFYVISGGSEPTCEHTNKVAIGEAKEPTCTEVGITAGIKCADCGETITEQEEIPVTGHDFTDATKETCANCEEPNPNYNAGGGNGEVEATPITASKTMAELITSEGWTSSTTKQTFKLDDYVTVKIDGGSNSGKAYDGNHIRIYATDSPAGSITITVPEGYELVSVKVTCQTGTYAFLCVGEDTTTDISNELTLVSGNSVVLNSVRNGTNGKQVRVTAIEVVYKAV